MPSLLPRISRTEREALTAGTVWVEEELLSGRPDLERLAALPWPRLRADEEAFLAGPVREVCEAVDEWTVQESGELPAAAWKLLRRHRFFGLTLPVEHGGHGFSALAASAVYGTLASRSLALSVVVVIPNSVGPGELLLAHGTEEQKRRLLPRLARGEEIPCFALTEPQAGSDAASLTSRGEVFRGPGGEPWLRLDFAKRYITLAPIATLIGLAFDLHDPEELLGAGPEPGITVALVPADTPGVEIGARHDPLGMAFPNGPLAGRGVEVPASAIVGGAAGAGRGWGMLMEALAGGRGVSLPAQAAAGAKAVARVTGTYTRVRRQFGQPVGDFEGVQERLGRIAGTTWLMEAGRVLLCGAVDAGERPAVAATLVKVLETELARQVVADAMDVLGGAAICRGPRNPLGDAWRGVPIGITVEGANILGRTLIGFGQGVVRSHPRVRRLLAAAEAGGRRRVALAALRFLAGTAVRLGRAALPGPRGRRSPVVPSGGVEATLWRRFDRAARRLALWSDVALLTHGPRLETRGALAGRFSDQLGWLLLLLAALRRFAAEGRRQEDLPLLRWGVEQALLEIERAHQGVLANLLPRPWSALLAPATLAARLRPLGRPPADELTATVARVLTHPGPARDRLTAGTFVSDAATDPRRRLEEAFLLAVAAEPLERRVAEGRRAGTLGSDEPAAAREAGVLTAAEAETLAASRAAAAEVTAADVFPATAAPTAAIGRPAAVEA